MPSSRPVPAQPAESPTRMEAARARLAATRRGITIAAFASFGVGLALVRASHPAVTHGSPQGLAAPASLVAEIQGSNLGGGSIAFASGTPQATTSAS